RGARGLRHRRAPCEPGRDRQDPARPAGAGSRPLVGTTNVRDPVMRKRETWLLVADAAEARLLRLDAAEGGLEVVEELQHVESRTKAGELLSDRQGRTFDSSHVGGRHAMEPRTDPKAIERQRFARQLATALGRAAEAQRFQELVLVAEPTML